MINLHRVFIEFPSHPLLPYSSPRVEAHVATALKQALATIRTVHNSTAEHDIFLVSGEICHYQWNALLTLTGIMLAYPFRP
jgi:hypothetical protein